MLAYSIAASAKAASGASSAIRRAAAGAGAATTTASTSRCSTSVVGPTESRQPSDVRVMARTVESRRTSMPSVAATAAGSWPTPPTSPAKTGPVVFGGSARGRGAREEVRTQRGDLRRGRAQGERVGMTGVHPAEQRLDEPVEHVTAQPLGDERRDRDILVGHRDDVRVDIGDAGRGQRVDVSRDAHDRRRHRSQGAMRPDRRGDRAGVDHLRVETDGVDEVERLGPAGEHRLRTEVERQVADRAELELAAEAIRSLEHDDLGTADGQLVRRSEAGHATADDRYAHE